MCRDCIKLTVDISDGIQREAVVNFCRDCDRWLLPPATWQVAPPESRELLAICLKKLKLRHVRVVDASFIWTEPHSRRLKVKITVQDSVSEVLIQQSFVVTYVVHAQQCSDCSKSFTPNYWRASVQVRQKVRHPRLAFPILVASSLGTIIFLRRGWLLGSDLSITLAVSPRL